MRNRLMSLAVVLLAAATVTSWPALAQGPAAIAPMHVHHVHLNSVNPSAAAAYYPKAFPISATKTTFNGYEAVKTGNVYLLFTKVNTPPQTELNGPQTSVWHFGWHTPDSRKYDQEFRAKGLKIAQMWDAADGSSSICRATLCLVSRRKSKSWKCEPRACSQRERAASVISAARTTR
jgi:hypothetical protein